MSVSRVEMLQLKIMYLFMNVDGSCGEEEVARFSSICDELKASKEDKNEISEFIKKFEFAKDNDNSELVINAVGTLLGYIKETEKNKVKYDDKINCFLAISGINRVLGTLNSGRNIINSNKERQAHTIWTLINLGYADKMLVPSEQKVIDYLVSVWEMDKVLTAALFDTAETMLALQMKKEWVISTDKAPDEKDKLCAEIDKEIEKMYDDVKLTISEASI